MVSKEVSNMELPRNGLTNDSQDEEFTEQASNISLPQNGLTNDI